MSDSAATSPCSPRIAVSAWTTRIDALEAAMASGDAAAAEREAHSLKASPAACRSCAFTTWPRESPMHCTATISTAPRTLMPDLRESHVAVLEALKNLEEWGLSTSMR